MVLVKPFSFCGSFREGLADAGDADAVIGEVVVHLGNIFLGHVAGGAVFPGYRAGLAGMICGDLRAGRVDMALEAGVVIIGRGSLQLLMRIMACAAYQADIALCPPAFAGDQPVGRGARGGDALGSGEFHIPPGTVTGSAEVYLVGWIEMRGIKDAVRVVSLLGGEELFHAGGVAGSGALTGV